MNTPSQRPCARVLRTLLAAFFCLAALLPLHAENWQTFDIAAPAGRFSHGFTLEVGGQPHGFVQGVVTTDSLGYMSSTVLPYLRLTLTLDRDQPGLTLRDTSTGEAADLISAPWNELGLLIPGEHDFRAPPGTPHTRSLFLLEDRSGNQLFLCQPGGVAYPVSILSSVSYYSGITLHDAWAYEGRALFDPALPYRIADLTTGEQTPFHVTDLTLGWVWEPGTGDIPLVSFTLYIEEREAGHHFHVHSRAAWGPELTSAVSAVTESANGTMLNFSVGAGMEFWITRAADGYSSQTAFGGNFQAGPAGEHQW